MFQKKIKKYIFDVKFPVLLNDTGRIDLNIEDRPENRKKPSIIEKFIAQTFREGIAFPRLQKSKNE